MRLMEQTLALAVGNLEYARQNESCWPHYAPESSRSGLKAGRLNWISGAFKSGVRHRSIVSDSKTRAYCKAMPRFCRVRNCFNTLKTTVKPAQRQ